MYQPVSALGKGLHVEWVNFYGDHTMHACLSDQAGERCALLGYVEARAGKLSRFELIIRGSNVSDVHNDGMAAGPLTVKPKGKIDVGLAFMRVDPKGELARVRPLASRDCGGGEEK
jgi:hypothetical protein